VVLPRDRTHAPNSPIEFINPPGSSTLRIVLPHRVALRLTVVDDTGGPVTDTRVQLLRSPAGRPVTIWSTVVDPGPRAGWPAGWPEGSPEGSPEGWPEKDQLADQPVEQLDTARTDAAGRATLYVHHNGDHLAIRVLGPGHAPTVFAPSVIAAAQTPMLIRVARGATLRGTVAPLDDLNRQVDPASPRPRSIQRPWVDLRALDRGVAARTIKAPIGADGAFVVQDLPPGRWEVSCRIGPSDGSRQALDPGTATIWLGAGEDRHLALQPTRRAPTSPTLPERGRTRRP
jgi:hypothetical protein